MNSESGLLIPWECWLLLTDFIGVLIRYYKVVSNADAFQLPAAIAVST